MSVAEAFGMEKPVPDLRELADVATAEHIANQIPAGGVKRERLLGEILDPIIAEAIASCRAAHDAWLEAAAAEEVLGRARQVGHFQSEALEQIVSANGFTTESPYDGDDLPKDTHAEGGGEADAPQHGDGCGQFLGIR